MFHSLLGASSIANKALLLAVSAPHAASWISVVPSVSLGPHLDPSDFQVAIKWWLGMDTSGGSLCSLCPEVRDVFAEAYRRRVRIEMGSGLTPDHNHSRPADVLVEGWERGKPAAFDITVTSPLCPAFLGEASQVAGAAALPAETRKHIANDKRCQELGWACLPIAVETYGNWVKRQSRHFHDWHLVWLLTPHNQSLKLSLTSMDV